MSKMTTLRRVRLAPHHLRPGRTRHYSAGPSARVEFPPFTALAITQFPGDPGYYLMHICEDGQTADTWHQSLEEAIHQAQWEFDVTADEWVEVNEPFS